LQAGIGDGIVLSWFLNLVVFVGYRLSIQGPR
jgi:hypothetical protein